MSVVIFVRPDGRSEEILVAPGVSVMRAAVQNSVTGIVGECGGQAMCATCHVYVEAGEGELPEPSEDEAEMLECTVAERRPESRLGCQLRAGDHFESLRVRLPERQV